MDNIRTGIENTRLKWRFAQRPSDAEVNHNESRPLNETTTKGFLRRKKPHESQIFCYLYERSQEEIDTAREIGTTFNLGASEGRWAERHIRRVFSMPVYFAED
jgi:hypothetical protein